MSRRLGAWGTTMTGCLAILSCGQEAEPRAEWLVSVSTDVPVPQLADRLLVETLLENGELACEGCRRVLGASSAQDFPVSFSVVPNGERLLLRSRLYRSQLAGPDGLPTTDLFIDHIGLLPETTTRIGVSVELALACIGVPADLSGRRSCSAESGQLEDLDLLAGAADPSLTPGGAALAAVRPCATQAPDGMLCVNGGLFIRGDQTALSLQPGADSRPEQLVRLSPFFLDQDEVSVGTVRELILSDKLSEAPAKRNSSAASTASCTFVGMNNTSSDAYPINCISLSLAEQVCQAQGKRLPTEAEWEYAAGNLSRETRFAWGADASVCLYAVVARASQALAANGLGDSTCLGETDVDSLTLPIPGGRAEDVTDLGVRNLAGNLSELVADEFAPYPAPCWTAAAPTAEAGNLPLLENPRCDDTPRTDFPIAVRGSSWAGRLLNAAAVTRDGLRLPSGDSQTGFRCAQSAE